MKSPFPGMDPYIEDRGLWRDFHDDLIGEIKRALAPLLPERYFVQLGERSYVVMEGADVKEEKSFHPDVGVESVQRENTSRAGAAVLAEHQRERGLAGESLSLGAA